MLCLSRREGEDVFVGDNIVITLIEADRGRCRIGITAPKEIEILRRELVPPGDPRLAITVSPPAPRAGRP